MDRRLFLVLGLSLVVALVISSVFYFQIAGRSAPAKDTSTKDVVVAVKQLEVGVTVKPGDVRIAKVSMDSFPKGAFGKVDEVLDRPVVNKILMDEPLLEGRLALRGSGLGLAPMIEVGMRAVSVRVSDVAGVAGFVLPGLRVDVLVTGRPTGSEGTVTTTCLQNILVLSAGQTIQPDTRGQAINTPTVTLLATPEQAEILTLAGNEGRIQLVLRNSSDQTVAKTPGTDIATLYSSRGVKPTPKPADASTPKPRPAVVRPKIVAMTPAAPPPAPAPPPEIVVIRGNTRSVEVVPQKAN